MAEGVADCYILSKECHIHNKDVIIIQYSTAYGTIILVHNHHHIITMNSFCNIIKHNCYTWLIIGMCDL